MVCSGECCCGSVTAVLRQVNWPPAGWHLLRGTRSCAGATRRRCTFQAQVFTQLSLLTTHSRCRRPTTRSWVPLSVSDMSSACPLAIINQASQHRTRAIPGRRPCREALSYRSPPSCTTKLSKASTEMTLLISLLSASRAAPPTSHAETSSKPTTGWKGSTGLSSIETIWPSLWCCIERYISRTRRRGMSGGLDPGPVASPEIDGVGLLSHLVLTRRRGRMRPIHAPWFSPKPTT